MRAVLKKRIKYFSQLRVPIVSALIRVFLDLLPAPHLGGGEEVSGAHPEVPELPPGDESAEEPGGVGVGAGLEGGRGRGGRGGGGGEEGGGEAVADLEKGESNIFKNVCQ